MACDQARAPCAVGTAFLLRWADGRAFIGGTASGGSARVIRLNYSGGSSVFICRGLSLHGAHRCKTGQDMSSQPPATDSLRWSVSATAR